MATISTDTEPRSDCARYRHSTRHLSVCVLAGLVLWCTGCTPTNERSIWESARYHGMMLLAITLTEGTPTTVDATDPHKDQQTTSQATPAEKHVLYFTANWCGPCRRWQQQQLPALEAQGWNSDWITLVDIDAHPDLRRQYRITAVPTFIVLRGEQEVSRRTGSLAANTFARWVNDL
ncbi:MAG: hypothetical protein CMJ46_04015 [Planctomyces sp.]|nr:hypothetical protein [Planctomyces sp.]